MSVPQLAFDAATIWTKICGVRDPEQAAAVAAATPSAIGLNFFPSSVRYVSDEAARRIVGVLPETIATIGVFVNEPLHEVIRRVDEVGLDGVQFHGDEPPELLADFHQRCPKTLLLRAFRYGPAGLVPIHEYLSECDRLGVSLSGCLLDAHSGNAYGGTGTPLPWAELRRALDYAALPPIILAGGLRPENVTAALESVRPRGLDVASGVESSPGVKDPLLVAELLRRVREWSAAATRNEA